MPFNGPVISGVTSGGAEVAFRVNTSGQQETVIPAGTTSIGKAEDAPHASGDVGVLNLGVRTDAPVVLTSATNDYAAVTVGRHGEMFVRTIDAAKRTYAAAAKFVPTTTGVVFEMLGVAAPAVIEVNRLTITALATAAGTLELSLNKRSAVTTGGTATSPTKVPYDSGDAAAGAVPRVFTVSGTGGTLVGAVRQIAIPVAANVATDRLKIESGAYAKSLTLLSATQLFTLDLAGTIPTGLTLWVDVEWTEF